MRKIVSFAFVAIVIAALVTNIGIAIANALGFGTPVTYWDIALLTGAPAALVSGFVTLRRSPTAIPAGWALPVLSSLTALIPGVILTSVFHMSAPFAIVVNLVVGALCGWVLTQDRMKGQPTA